MKTKTKTRRLALLTLFATSICLLSIKTSSAQVLYAAEYYTGIYTLSSNGTASSFSSNVHNPAGIAFDDQGDLFVANQGNGTISEITTNGTVSTFATGFTFPLTQMAFNTSGDLFAANGNTISEITPAGTVSIFVSDLETPRGLAFDTNGNLFVSIAGTGSIDEITTNGSVSTFATGFSAGENGPEGLAFNSSGTLFVADYPSGHVDEVTTNGVVSTFATGLSPIALAFNSSGNLFVGQEDESAIEEITPDGTVSTFATVGRVQGLAFSNTPLPVPEPSTYALMALGIGALVSRIVSRRRA